MRKGNQDNQLEEIDKRKFGNDLKKTCHSIATLKIRI
jgi:hypothetical protein